ncbi:MAG: hypothetical protein Q4D38_06095 [Planctomycetia bacterium]|nr:hypothetical protein [Planctomycetia bacterium]
MCLVNKILIGLIVVAVLVCFYFGSITLKTHDYWHREQYVEKYQKAVKEAQALNNRLKYGVGIPGNDNYEPSVEAKRIELDRLENLRGLGVWLRSPASLRDGKITAEIEGINAIKLPISTRVFVFDDPDVESDEPSRYLGTFIVERCADGEVVLRLQDSVAIDKDRVEELKLVYGAVSIYQKMPLDSHDIFEEWYFEQANLDREEFFGINLPKNTMEEYEKHGREDASGAVFERPLRSYDIQFQTYYDGIWDTKQTILDVADLVVVTQAMEECLARRVEFLEKRNSEQAQRLQVCEQEQVSVADRRKSLESTYRKLEAEHEKTLREISACATQIYNLQRQIQNHVLAH